MTLDRPPSSYVNKCNPSSNNELSSAEKGILDNSNQLPVVPLAAMTRVVINLSLTKTPPLPVQGSFIPLFGPPSTSALEEKKLQPAISEVPSMPPPKLSVRNIRKRMNLVLWFNAYRRFFAYYVTLNGIGLVSAALGTVPICKEPPGPLARATYSQRPL
jgi:hypothetical protein